MPSGSTGGGHPGAALGSLLASGFQRLSLDHLRALTLMTFLAGVLVILLLVFGCGRRQRPSRRRNGSV